jgi:hypothetical protein
MNDAVTRQRSGSSTRAVAAQGGRHAREVRAVDHYALAEEKPGVVLAEWIGFDRP